MRTKVFALTLTTVTALSSPTIKAGGIPVIDAVNIVQTTATALQTFEHWRQYLEEFAIIEEQIRGIADLIGDDGLDIVLEKLEEEWGTENMIDAISMLDPESDIFLDDVNDLLESVLGNIALDDEEIDALIEGVGFDDETAEALREDFVMLRNRDAYYKAPIYAASQSDMRRAEMQEMIFTAKDQLAGMGEKSQLASTQFVGETNLLLANQNQEMWALLSRMLARDSQDALADNMDEITGREERYKQIEGLKASGFEAYNYSEMQSYR